MSRKYFNVNSRELKEDIIDQVVRELERQRIVAEIQNLSDFKWQPINIEVEALDCDFWVIELQPEMIAAFVEYNKGEWDISFEVKKIPLQDAEYKFRFKRCANA